MSTVSPPQLITPPSGLCDVLAFDAATNTVELLGSFEDATRAHTTMRKRGGGSACLARGGVVCSFASQTPLSHHPRIKAAVALEWARRAAPAPAETTVDVEPSAPSTTTDHDEEPMKTDADETPCCDAHECEDLRAGVRADTKPEIASFCRHHRKVAVDRVRDHGVSLAEVAAALREGRSVEAAPSKPARKAPAAKPSKPLQSAKPTKAPKPPPPPSNDPGDILFEALRGLRGEQISAGRVREIVREELATAFASLRGRT